MGRKKDFQAGFYGPKGHNLDKNVKFSHFLDFFLKKFDFSLAIPYKG